MLANRLSIPVSSITGRNGTLLDCRATVGNYSCPNRISVGTSRGECAAQHFVRPASLAFVSVYIGVRSLWPTFRNSLADA